jgi:hypothetical protein
MSGLRPIGSEKLEGLDKIKRIIEISRYNEHVPQPVNENESKEYRLDLADGNTYEIVRERQGYIIKKNINESSVDYIEPIQNRKYFSSYSQALKKLNLMAKEFNTLHENTEGTSLFNEQKKKYKLKVRKPKADAEPVNEPAPAPVAEVPPAPVPEIPAEPAMPPMDAETPPMGGPDMPLPGGEEPMPEPGMPGMEEEPMPEPGMEEEPGMGGEEPEMEDEEIDVEVEKEKGPSEFKRIQILVGKLAQKIRQYEEDKDLSAKDVKYIINSILSALDVEVLDEDDIEQIIAKLEGEEDEESEEEEVDVDMEEEMPSDMEGEEEPELAEMDFASLAAAQGEVTEYDNLADAVGDYVGASYGNTMMSKLTDELSEEDDEDEDLDIFVQKMKRYDRSPETYARKQADIDIRDFLNKGGDFHSDKDSMKKSPIDYDIDFEEIGEGDDENYKLRRRGSRMINPRTNHFAHGTFNESKVDSVLSKYFVLTEAEVEKNRVEKREKQEEIYRINKKNIIALAESTEQLKSALWYIKHNPESELMGLSNRGNMIFKEGLNDTKITKKGDIL